MTRLPKKELKKSEPQPFKTAARTHMQITIDAKPTRPLTTNEIVELSGMDNIYSARENVLRVRVIGPDVHAADADAYMRHVRAEHEAKWSKKLPLFSIEIVRSQPK